MDRIEEIKFLMSLYEKMKELNSTISKTSLDLKYKEQIKRLLDNDDISKDSCEIIGSILGIDIIKTNSQTTTTTSFKSTSRTYEPDPCSRGYSGSRVGGC